ncbi:MAG TPA: IS30 family transposase [Pontiellaceae bacterium]|nr:IS30 family transposase [Pontiellaceae bacterium]
MEQQNANTSPRKGKQLNRDERIQIEVLLKRGSSPKQIASLLGRHVRTIEREVGRGSVEHLHSDLTRSAVYSSDRGEAVHRLNATAKGPPLKLGRHYQTAEFIRFYIVEKRFSPDVVAGLMKQQAMACTLCTKTIYSYIEDGWIAGVTNESLWEKRKRRRKTHKRLFRRAKRAASAGRGIADRPSAVSARAEFGHWEIDLIVSGKDTGPGALMTLVERKTRKVIVRKLKDRTQQSVTQALNGIERSMGKEAFRTFFKSISADNGSEFLHAEALETSALGGHRRTRLYYAHPYASWERGSNENTNRIIRRFLPKGISLSRVTRPALEQIEDWINTCPRRILGFKTAEELFIQEIAA